MTIFIYILQSFSEMKIGYISIVAYFCVFPWFLNKFPSYDVNFWHILPRRVNPSFFVNKGKCNFIPQPYTDKVASLPLREFFVRFSDQYWCNFVVIFDYLCRYFTGYFGFSVNNSVLYAFLKLLNKISKLWWLFLTQFLFNQ